MSYVKQTTQVRFLLTPSCILRLMGSIVYGLTAAVFSQNITRAIDTAHKLKAGTAWVRIRSMSPRIPMRK